MATALTKLKVALLQSTTESSGCASRTQQALCTLVVGLDRGQVMLSSFGAQLIPLSSLRLVGQLRSQAVCSASADAFRSLRIAGPHALAK